jgi:hypothetical protein
LTQLEPIAYYVALTHTAKVYWLKRMSLWAALFKNSWRKAMIRVEMTFENLNDLRSQLFDSTPVAPAISPDEAADTKAPPKRRRSSKKKTETAEEKPKEEAKPPVEQVDPSAEQIAECRKALIGACDRTDMQTVLGLLKQECGDGVTRADEVPGDKLQDVIDAANKLGA